MKILNAKITSKIRAKKGFAMLFTVLIMSLILTIAVGISNITFKQTILSGLAKDSQIAFYQADRGIECGMYYDITVNAFPKGTVTPQNQITCGNSQLTYDAGQSASDHFVFVESSASNTSPCVTVTFDKTDALKYTVYADGYNLCGESPRKVERSLSVTY
jgi:hypothetical protein